MRYFVISPDGSKYGPADLATLRAWVAQGRISPDTVLEEEMSHQRVPARMVAGLTFGEIPSFSGPPQMGGARPAEFSRGKNGGDSDVMWSYIYSALTLICCCFFNIAGFVYANRAISKGNPKGKGARIFAIIMMLLWIITTLIMIPFLGQAKDILMNLLHQSGAQ